MFHSLGFGSCRLGDALAENRLHYLAVGFVPDVVGDGPLALLLGSLSHG